MTEDKILIVEDEAGVRASFRIYFEAHGLKVIEAENCEMAKTLLRKERPDLAILDYRLPDGNAIDLLTHLSETSSHIPTIVLTSYEKVELAVRAMKAGADQFLTKPIPLDSLLVVVQRTLKAYRKRRKNLAFSLSSEAREPFEPFAGTSAAIAQIKRQAQQLAGVQLPTLIQGETGTGKGVLARWLHQHGPRSEEPFVDLNCAGLSRELAESELFGHSRGSFTGAMTSKTGLMEVAHRGTLFLDEIGDLDLQVQPKLLKVLEESTFRRVGEVQPRTTDVSLIVATHRDLALAVDQGSFRSDLYYRICRIIYRLPALRERREDIVVLAGQIIDGLSHGGAPQDIELGKSAIAALEAYPWPGNIRELRNVLERGVLLCRSGQLEAEDLHLGELPSAPPVSSALSAPVELTLREVERNHIVSVLRFEKGRVEDAARRLGIPRSSLYKKLKAYGIEH